MSAATSTASPDSTTPPANPTASAAMSASAASAAPRPPAPQSGPVASMGSVRCGEGHCLLPQHACCEGMLPSGEKAATCAPFRAHDWRVQLTACRGFEWVETIRHCDSAADCPADEVCCTDFIGEVEVVSLCKPLPANGESPCTEHQRCLVDDKPCRQRNTVCREGQCKRRNVAVDCGKAGRCRGATPLCCVDNGVPRCSTYADCVGGVGEGRIRVECDSSKDCLRGQQCCSYVINDAFCTGFCPFAHCTLACQTDRDCPTADPARPQCVHTAGVVVGRCEETRP